MREEPKYLKIVRSRGEQKLPLERVFRNMLTEELFLIAYSKVSSNKGAMTAGTDKDDTTDGMSIKRISRIITSLKEGSYKPKPVRREYIPKSNGKLRPLGIPNFTDRLIQEVVRMILNEYYEPQFSNLSHGFRPGRGCHTALNQISKNWKGTKWFVEGDIKGCFDNIDHDLLIQIMEKKIKDNRLLSLIRKWLKAGYVENWKYNETYSGTPQGGVISPILTNIYLNELDAKIEEKMLSFNKGVRRRVNPEWNRFNNAYQKAKRLGNKQEALRIKKEFDEAKSNGLPYGDPNDPNFKRIKYARYADDFLVGIVGSKEEAHLIKQEISKFLLDDLKLTLSNDKTKITHARTNAASFLGYEISTQHSTTRKGINGEIVLRMPIKVEREWIKRYSRNGKPYHRTELLNSSDHEIISQMNSELYGLYEYYKMAQNVRRIYNVKYVALQTTIKTLATKHNTSVPRAMRKYSHKANGVKGLIAKSVANGKTYSTTFGCKPIKWNKYPKAGISDTVIKNRLSGRSDLLTRISNDTCELCGNKGDIEVHHIRHMKDIKKGKADWQIRMSAMNRKTLIVCPTCHDNIHAGRHDGQSLKG